MHEHNFTVQLRDKEGGVLAEVITTATAMRAGEKKRLLEGVPELEMKPPGSLFVGDTLLRDQEVVDHEEKFDIWLDVKEVFDKVEDDPDRLPGKVCHNCYIWDHAEGKRIFTMPTHRYDNGSFAMYEEITKAVSAKNHARTLTPDNVGYCSSHLKLCAESGVACKNYDPKPWIARFRNWWIRAFR